MAASVSPLTNSTSGPDEDLRRACRGLDSLGSLAWISFSALAYALLVVLVQANLTLPANVTIAARVMWGLLLVGTLLAGYSLLSMRLGVRWLYLHPELPAQLGPLREAGSVERDAMLDGLAGRLAAAEKWRGDRRVLAAAHRLRALVIAVQRRPATARVHLAMAKATVDDDYNGRPALHLISQVLLYSGIIATLYGLFVSFNDAKLSQLLRSLTETQRVDLQAFREVIVGFTIAFGASAFGYVAFLCSRWQQEIADRHSVRLALLLENDLSEAVTRAFAPLAAEVPIMSPDTEEVLKRLQSTVSSEVAKRVNNLAAVAEAVTKASETLVGRLEAAGQAWAGASEQFARKVDEAARAIETAARPIGDTAQAVADAAAQLVNSARTITDALARGAETINATLDVGLQRILERTNSQVEQFKEALDGFRAHIDAQVRDFREAHEDTTRGRAQLEAAIRDGHRETREVVQQVRGVIDRLVEADGRLREAVRQEGGGLSAQLGGMGHCLQSAEAELRAMHARLDELVGLASGTPANGRG